MVRHVLNSNLDNSLDSLNQSSLKFIINFLVKWPQPASRLICNIFFLKCSCSFAVFLQQEVNGFSNVFHSLYPGSSQNESLIVCVRFIVPLENFSPIWRCHHYRWRAANFDLCSALMAIEQWGFFLTFHTSCDTGHPFTMIISEDLWH